VLIDAVFSPGRWCNLPLAFAEIESRIQLRLAHEQFVKARFMRPPILNAAQS
jgi:hypothetical protein